LSDQPNTTLTRVDDGYGHTQAFHYGYQSAVSYCANSVPASDDPLINRASDRLLARLINIAGQLVSSGTAWVLSARWPGQLPSTQEVGLMVDFHHVSGQAAECLKELADRARATLLAAGIPVSDSESTSLTGGALIEVDTGDEAAGGVYISWDLSRELNDEINNYLLSGQTSHPTIQYAG
jgi:hypothetical protein